MIQVAPQMRVLVAVQPADFRKGIDGLAKLARDELAQDPDGLAKLARDELAQDPFFRLPVRVP